ncbi:ABC TRANSPORTER G FAMILY MEMBER 24 [Salix koriyanagi]|uniref:ABC TRANSPORTER G FAMILY MEMBER 24 n=1 Tax=Salix koriyanagi TaxID=2511006 RepID=A0A9Q0W6L4_9ROSI|nr:ABC TRANSPORTER G FAMILY MEMBER 24 [Salix koriyanagi]
MGRTSASAMPCSKCSMIWYFLQKAALLSIMVLGMKKVEKYFAGLGISVPERVNPPDHYIDILEGIVKSSASSSANYKELPLMQKYAAGIVMSPVEVNPDHGTNPTGVGEQSFAGELWQDVKSNVEFHRDKIRHKFLKSSGLSHRRTPGVFHETNYRKLLGQIWNH